MNSIWHFNVVKYLEKINNSSTTSLVQHHAQPVGEHACSMNHEGYLSSAVVCIEMVFKLTHLWFHQFFSAPWGSTTPILHYPQCFTLINCTGIINPPKRKAQTWGEGGVGRIRMMCRVANVLMRSPLKRTHCDATQHSLATSRVVRMRGKNTS